MKKCMDKTFPDFQTINKSNDCYLTETKHVHVYNIYLLVKGKNNNNHCGYIGYHVVRLNSKVSVCTDSFNVFSQVSTHSI